MGEECRDEVRETGKALSQGTPQALSKALGFTPGVMGSFCMEEAGGVRVWFAFSIDLSVWLVCALRRARVL